MQGTWVQSLVRELRSHMPRGIAKKKKKRKRNTFFLSSPKYTHDQVCIMEANRGHSLQNTAHYT